MKRRDFVKRAAITASTVSIVPRHVLGKGFTPPSDKLNMAAIGVGGKGAYNIRNAYNGGSDNIVALCDVDERQAANARKQFTKAAFYRDYRKMLEEQQDQIDGVLISTPDHMHAIQSLDCMSLGKHVYVEKPLTHDISEARALTKAATRYQVVSQMGNQGSSGNDTRLIETWIQGGIIGDVHTVHVWTNRPVWPQGVATPSGNYAIPQELDWDLWLGTAPHRAYNPAYHPAEWRGWGDFGTGALGDMGCHFMDVPFMALKLGYPESVTCSTAAVWTGFFEEVIYTDSFPPASKIHLQFPARGIMPSVSMSWYDGGILPERPAELLPDEEMGEWDGGMIFEGTQGKLMAGLFGRNPTLLPSATMASTTLPKSKKPFVEGGSEGHQQQWVKACKEGYGAYTSSPFSVAGPLTETVLMGNLAVRSFNFLGEGGPRDFPGRKKLLWDGENMRITNFEPANQFVKREYRTGW